MTTENGRKKCTACGRTQQFKNFPHLGNNRYGDKCYPCKSKDDAADLKKEAERRYVEREIKKRRKQLLKEEANQLAKNKIVNEKKRKAYRDEKLAANQEFARRELSRRKLLYYIMRFNQNYKAGWVHRDICERIERFVRAVLANEDPRIMFCMPPRTGKSTIVSNEAPSWVLGNYPEMEFISASYGLKLPVKFSRYVRGRLRDPNYQAIFPETKLDPDNQNVEGWMTTKGGIYIPAGVGVGITGMGANIFNIDDPFKDDKDADSDIQREDVWDWYGSVAYTRLAPNSGIMLTNTRWHFDDLSGRVLEQQEDSRKQIEQMRAEFEQEMSTKNLPDREVALREALFQDEIDSIIKSTDWWDVVVYSAIAEHDEFIEEDGSMSFQEACTPGARKVRSKGEALHPERYPLSKLMRIKRTLQPRHWSALYQQNPVPDEGEYFQKDMMVLEPRFNWKTCQIIITGDLAIGTKSHNDYTVFAVGAIDHNGLVHVIDLVRSRWRTEGIQQRLLELCKTYYHDGDLGPMVPIVGIERGPLYEAVMPGFIELARKNNVRFVLNDDLKPVSDKDTRARPLQGMVQQGHIRFPKNASWLDIMMLELLRFPSGRFNDIVDALAWLARLALMTPPPPNREAINRRKTGEKSLKERLRDYMRGQRDGDGKSHMGA